MKKLLYIFIIALSGQMFAQSTVNLDLLVTDNSGMPIANQTVIVQDINGGSIFNYTYITNPSGKVMDSIGVQGTGALRAITTLNGCADTAVTSYNTTPSIQYFVDTLQLCSAAVNCNFAYGATPTGANQFTYNFWHQGNPTAAVTWSFGDGTTSTQSNPTHVYNASGVYIFCVTVAGCPTVCDTLIISSLPPPSSCQASFIIDTVNSQPGTVVVWNNSTPIYSPNTTTQYLWDFGDGTTSTNAFPTHTYSGAGTYALCLTVTVPPSALDSGCTSSFCDTLKVDANGNIIYKSTGASFTLNVLNANAISVDENAATEFNIYPNPVSDFIKIDFNANVSGTVTTEVLDINGRVILTEVSKSQNGNNQLRLDVSELTGGIYFIRMNLDGENHYEKILKQ